VIIAVTDDGRGIDVPKVRQRAADRGVGTDELSADETIGLIFRSGLSTAPAISEVSGRGVGLDVVRASVEAARGRIEVRSQPGAGSEFRLIVPITLAVLPCLIVSAGAEQFGLPLHRVILAQGGEDEGVRAEGRPARWIDDQPVGVSDLAETLGLPPAEPVRPNRPVVVLSGASHRHAFEVERLIGQRDVAVKGLGRLLPRLDAVAGASVDPDGSVLIVLDPPGLIERARSAGLRAGPALGGEGSVGAPADQPPADRRRGTILVVDDALTVRELQRSILERAGYEVAVAADGVEALAHLADAPVDLVLSDLDMPRLDGFGLTEAIRAQPATAHLPVVILTSRSSDEDRQRGLDVGADSYIVKSAFDEHGLLTAVERLLGSRA
jgi:two-component system chemotaxis sensor kinase CheA